MFEIWEGQHAVDNLHGGRFGFRPIAGGGAINLLSDGNDLHLICGTSRAEAQAYVLGFDDRVALRDEVNKQGGICAPTTVKSGQFVDLGSGPINPAIARGS